MRWFGLRLFTERWTWPVCVMVAWCGALLAPAGVVAAPLRVEVESDKVAIDEPVVVTARVNARHVRLVLPDTDDFVIENVTNEFNQPLFCMSMGLTVISGPCTFTFHFLPKRAGVLTIPSFQIVDDFWYAGRVLGQTGEIKVEVSPQPSGRPKPPARGRSLRKRRGGRIQGGGPGPQEGGPTAFPESQEPLELAQLQDLEQFAKYDLFLLPTLDKKFVYLNEPFKVDFVLYVGDNSGASELRGLELPELEGFRKEQVETEEKEGKKISIGEKRYLVHLLARYVLVPLEAGVRTLSPARAVVLASVSSFRKLPGGFTVSFSTSSQPVDVFSPPVRLEVRPLPNGAPPGFSSGNVGIFTLSDLEIPPPQPAGSWVVLKYTVAGSGNLLSLSPPRLPEDPAIDMRSTYVDSGGVKIDELGIHGKLSVQLPLRLKQPGEFAVGPLRLVYFDPMSGRYGESVLEVPKIHALQPTTDAGEVVEVRPEEIQGIVTDADIDPETRGPWLSAVSVAWGIAGTLGIWLFCVLLRAVLASLGKDTDRKREKKAIAAARRSLASARKAAQGQSPEKVYSLVARSLGSYLEARFGISVGSATHDQVEKELLARGVPADLAAAVRAELENSEFGRFAPSALLEKDMVDACRRTNELIRQLDRCKTRTK